MTERTLKSTRSATTQNWFTRRFIIQNDADFSKCTKKQKVAGAGAARFDINFSFFDNYEILMFLNFLMPAQWGWIKKISVW